MDGIRRYLIRRSEGMKRRIIVEGPSERAYMQRLMSFLESDMPLDVDGYSSRLVFYPTVTNNRIGGGSYNLVYRTYREVSPRNLRTPLMIWVDRDIYVRNSNRSERASAAGYANKGTLPDFYFSVMNFEDFLALHFESELFNRWKESLNQNQHFAVPLHGDDYDALWRPVWKDFLDVHSEVGQGAYKKGSLPEGFVSLASLRNLCENVRDPMMAGIFAKHSSSSAPAFPVWLADTLRQIYPEEFS